MLIQFCTLAWNPEGFYVEVLCLVSRYAATHFIQEETLREKWLACSHTGWSLAFLILSLRYFLLYIIAICICVCVCVCAHLHPPRAGMWLICSRASIWAPNWPRVHPFGQKLCFERIRRVSVIPPCWPRSLCCLCSALPLQLQSRLGSVSVNRYDAVLIKLYL